MTDKKDEPTRAVPAEPEEARALAEELSELKANYEEVRKELDQERKLFADGPVVLFKWKNAPDRPLEYVSENVASLLGHSAEDLMSGRVVFSDLVHPKDLGRVVSEIERFSRDGRDKFVHDPYRMVRSDGRRIWVLDNTAVIRNGEGGVAHFLGYMLDITEAVEAERALRESEARLSEAQRMARIGNWEWIVDSDEIHWSEEVYRIFGLDSKRFEPDFAKYVSLIHPEDREMVVEAVNNALSRGGGYGVEHRILLENGEVRHIQGIGAVALDKEGRPVRMAGTVQDVTDKVLREEVLREREEMLRAMSNAAHDAMIMIDAEDTVYFWNKAAESMFGYSSEEAMGAKMHELITLDEDRTRANVGLAKFGETGRGPVLDSVMEFTAVRKNGETFPVERSVAAFQLGEEWYAVGSLRDITRRKRDEARLKELATTDGLTGLNNRRHFMELAGMHLEQAGRYSKPFSLITLDVDYFKSVNDTYGHDAGDRVLTTLSRLCEDACRKVDVVGRLGGEEFAVAMPETGPEEARRAAERLRRVMAEAEVDVRGGKIGFTVSLGVASLSPEIESLEQLLKSADEALYRAKQGGRNRVETDE